MKYRPIQESIPLPGAILVTAFLLGVPGSAGKFDADSIEIEEFKTDAADGAGSSGNGQDREDATKDTDVEIE